MPKLLLHPDITNVIFELAGYRVPVDVFERLDISTLCRNELLAFHMKVVWHGWWWTPSHCNRLIITKKRGKVEACRYSAVTGLTPTLKEQVTAEREAKGLYPIWPGRRQYPTSRVRFDPARHVNDRYFR